MSLYLRTYFDQRKHPIKGQRRAFVIIFEYTEARVQINQLSMSNYFDGETLQFFFLGQLLYYYSSTLAHYITIQLQTLDKLSYKDDFTIPYTTYTTLQKTILLLLT